MRVRTALGLINQVLETVLGEQEADFDPETRWAIQWFTQFFEDEGPFGTANDLAVSMNVAVDGLVASGIVEAGGGRARLLSRDDLPDGWDPLSDDRVPVWEATQHLIRRLETEGEVSAARLFRQLGGMADSCKALAYRLYDVCESSRPGLAGPYNMLAAPWPEIQRLAAKPLHPHKPPKHNNLTCRSHRRREHSRGRTQQQGPGRRCLRPTGPGFEKFVAFHMEKATPGKRDWADVFAASAKPPIAEYSTSDPSFVEVVAECWKGTFDRQLPRSSKNLISLCATSETNGHTTERSSHTTPSSR